MTANESLKAALGSLPPAPWGVLAGTIVSQTGKRPVVLAATWGDDRARRFVGRDTDGILTLDAGEHVVDTIIALRNAADRLLRIAEEASATLAAYDAHPTPHQEIPIIEAMEKLREALG